MTLREFWCLYDAKFGEPKYGNLTESEVADLYDRMKAAKKALKEQNDGRHHKPNRSQA